MAESANIKDMVNQVAIKAVTAVMMTLRDVEAGPWPTTAAIHSKPQRQRHSGPVLEKLASNWGTQDRYAELMNFKMEVSNILETKAYELSEEEKAPLIEKNG